MRSSRPYLKKWPGSLEFEEMAGQPGVRWFAVTDEQGTIVMHSNSGMVGKQLYSPQEMQQLHPGEEMAGQPGVRWFAVTDEQGTIVMHSNSGMVGKQLYSPQEMQQLHPGDEEAWRRIDSADGEPVLEIYRQFQPMFAGMVGKQLYSPQEMQQLHPGNEEAWRRIDSADGEPVLEIYRQFQPMFATGMHRMRHMQQYAATPQAKKRGGGSIAQTASLFWKFIASFNRCLLLECTGCAICSSMPRHHKQFLSLSTPVTL